MVWVDECANFFVYRSVFLVDGWPLACYFVVAILYADMVVCFAESGNAGPIKDENIPHNI